jgi:L-alanine-DL-glutamate epimerase-like enolase superfamily enzyme
MIRALSSTPALEKLGVTVCKVPTDAPEADGTLAWDSTCLVVVEVEAGGQSGLGWTYADEATGRLVHGKLADLVLGHDAFNIPAAWCAMHRAVRNLGRPGVVAMAVAAVDTALWDLKARLLGLPLVSLLGQVRDAVPVYGSGGFTSYTNDRLREQLAGWAAQGIGMVKMKIGSNPAEDLGRVRAARDAVGPHVELFVDANGAYSRTQALEFAQRFADLGVRWFEEPVSSDDLEGLHFLRDRAPAGMDVAAGEYGYDLFYFRRMLEAGAVDCLQADLTRCAGLTGWLQAGTLCESRCLQLSGHCAPALHTHPACSAPAVRHLEYFHDHVRIEHLLFDGLPALVDGKLRPDLSRPGHGMEFKRPDARRYLVWADHTTK